MTDFFDSYETRPSAREKFVKYFFLAVAGIIVLFGVDWTLAKLGKANLSDFRPQWQARQFFQLLREQNYPEAYRLWGCDQKSPCRDYAFEKFMEDWGPKGTYSTGLASLNTLSVRHCDSGIIQTVTIGAPDEPVHLYVDRRQLTLSFSPWPVCNPRVPVP